MDEQEKHAARIPFLMRMSEIQWEIANRLNDDEHREFLDFMRNPDVQEVSDLPEKYQTIVAVAMKHKKPPSPGDIGGMV